MKTDDLVAMLARSAEAVDPRTPERRHGLALAGGALGAAALLAATLGVQPGIAEAARLPMFWVKLAFPATLMVGAALAVFRLSRPGAPLDAVPFILLLPLLGIWLLSAVALSEAGPGEAARLVLGESWGTCPIAIAFLSMPLLVAAFRALQGLAPTRPALAGAAAGLLAGSGGAVLYALYCTEMSAPFVATWYGLGMLIPTAAGAWLGPRLLRW
jgi:hypothetical protein